jgi:hypothetical protein
MRRGMRRGLSKRIGCAKTQRQTLKGARAMADKSDLLDDVAAATIKAQAKEIERLRKENAELRKQLSAVAVDSPFVFKIVYSEFVDGEWVRSCRGVDPQVLDAPDSGVWLVEQLLKMLDEVRQPPAVEGE